MVLQTFYWCVAVIVHRLFFAMVCSLLETYVIKFGNDVITNVVKACHRALLHHDWSFRSDDSRGGGARCEVSLCSWATVDANRYDTTGVCGRSVLLERKSTFDVICKMVQMDPLSPGSKCQEVMTICSTNQQWWSSCLKHCSTFCRWFALLGSGGNN